MPSSVKPTVGKDAFDDLAVGLQVVDEPLQHEPSAIDDRDVLGRALDLADLMRREDHPLPFAASLIIRLSTCR